jgi:orotate phosphoribosyltransferase
MTDDVFSDATTRLLVERAGHFRFESGHHGDRWLDLDALFLRPRELRPLVAELARRLTTHGVDVVCGPLVGGAFVALAVAEELGVAFCYAEGTAAGYRVPPGIRSDLRGRAVAVVDDVVNAGSAVRAVGDDLRACGARPTAIGALLVLGDAADRVAAGEGVPLEALARRDGRLWIPEACPLCAAGVPLEDGRVPPAPGA